MTWAPRILKWAGGILAVLIYLAWPYYALFDLASGIQSGDAATINRLVDWNSVRSSVKAQMQTLADVSRPAAQRGNPTAAAMSNAPMIAAANSYMDTVLTPEGVAKMLKDMRGTTPANRKASLRDLEGLLGHVQFAFFVSPIHFRLDLGAGRSASLGVPAVTVMMTFKGSGWQITDVKLPALDAMKNAQLGDARATRTLAAPR